MNSVATRLLVFSMSIGAAFVCRATFAAPPPDVLPLQGIVSDASGVTQRDAEEIFAEADAAIYFPALNRVRWVGRAAAVSSAGGPRRALTVGEFDEQLERDFPRFRSNAHGPYILKKPMAIGQVETAEASTAAAKPMATVFSESFESGMSNWTLDNNTLDLYSWGTTTCEARTGTRSADALRGGVNTLGCSDTYGPNVTTTMFHKNCEGIQGASQAWLDAYLHVATESGVDSVGFYYADAAGDGYGYGFSGTWSAWFHVVFNLKLWYRVGDLTAVSCPKLIVQFNSNATTQSGIGARIDDITIGNSTPSFLAASITATPSTGTVPLTVGFTSTVTGAAAGTAYLWSFDDAAGTTATTPNATFTYTTPGDYWPRLRVEESGVRVYARALVRAIATTPCSVSCSASAPSTAAAGSSALFQATATASGCSGTASYSWSFGDGQTSALQNASHAYAAAGTYTWTLTASVGGTSCTKSGSITVTSGGSKVFRRRAVLPPGADLLASSTIGASGGTLTGGGCTVTVPAGAFGTSTPLSLTRTSRARQEGDLSDTFGVKGLPTALGADLTLEVVLDAAPRALVSGEAVYVSFEGLGMDRDRNVEAAPFLLPANVSGRSIRATLPKEWGSATLAGAASQRASTLTYAPPAAGYQTKVTIKSGIGNDHFTMYADAADAAWARSALTTLEEAYQRLAALGFTWGCRQSGTFKKIPVYVQSLGTGETDAYGEQVSRLDPCGSGWVFTDFIRLNKDFSASSTAMRASIAHELFHFQQEMYVPTSVLDPNRALWIAEASSTWFESLFVAGSCPGVMTGSYQFPWRGLFNPAGSAVEGSGRRRIQNHGYGAAALLKYRTDASSAANDPFVHSIWSAMKSGNSELEAFQNAVGSSLPAFWKQFAKDYYTGSTGCSTYQQSSQKAVMKDAATLAQTFEFGAYPLSGISFLFDLQKLEITDKTPLPITAEGLIEGQSVFVYDVKSRSQLAELTKSANAYTIEDLTSYKGSVLVLTFVDANLPAGTGSTNQVRLTTGGTYKCYAVAAVYSMKEPISGGGWTTCTYGGPGTYCPLYDGKVTDHFIGTVQGDTFHADTMYCDDPPVFCRWRDDNASYKNSMDFTFTNKGATIENFRISQSLSTKYGGPWSETLTVSTAVPQLSKSAAGFQYKLTGSAVCASVKSSKGFYDIVCDGSSYFNLTCDAYTPPKK